MVVPFLTFKLCHKITNVKYNLLTFITAALDEKKRVSNLHLVTFKDTVKVTPFTHAAKIMENLLHLPPSVSVWRVCQSCSSHSSVTITESKNNFELFCHQNATTIGFSNKKHFWLLSKI